MKAGWIWGIPKVKPASNKKAEFRSYFCSLQIHSYIMIQTSHEGKINAIMTVLFFLVFTWLHHPRLGPQVGQVDVGLPAVNDWVWVFAGAVRSWAVRHRHLGRGVRKIEWDRRGERGRFQICLQQVVVSPRGFTGFLTPYRGFPDCPDLSLPEMFMWDCGALHHLLIMRHS